MIDQLAVLATLRFDWADTPDHVWKDSPYHVDGLHADVLASIEGGIKDAAGSDGPSPIGLVLQGQKGVGKTHLLGMVRRTAHLAGGYFFLCDVTSGDAFWENTAEALRRGLSRPTESGEPQIRTFLRHVCERAGLSQSVTATILSGHGLGRKDLDAFVDGLRRLDRQVGVECGDTARALVLYASEESALTDIGENHLEGFEELKNSERSRWGLRSRSKPALAQVQDITRLLALTGPLVMAVDQLDTLVAQSAQHTQRVGDAQDEDKLVAQIADGLMRLREVTRRTLTLLTCLPGTWTQIRSKATDSVPDRFRESRTLGRIPDATLGRALVAKRLGVVYEAIGFEPPYPTWPVAPTAFEGQWEQYTPRELLKRISAHIELCLKLGEIRELTSFDEREQAPKAPVVRSAPQPPNRFAKLDAEFEELKASADLRVLMDQKTEDEVMPTLLSAALRSWITEVGDDNMEWTRGTRSSDNSDLHAWLTHTLDEASDLEEHWAFRVITAKHPIAALARLRRARSAAGTSRGADNRHLVLVRDKKWSNGEKTQHALAEFKASGGLNVDLSKEDVRTFWALDRMLARGGNDVHEWLVDRRPASRSGLLSEALPKSATGTRNNGTHPPPLHAETARKTTEPEIPAGTNTEPATAARTEPATAAGPATATGVGTEPATPTTTGSPTPTMTGAPAGTGTGTPSATDVVAGTAFPLGQVGIELESLRQHTAVFAGSGSGKTVLLRRIIEECALRGVSAIVLDPNNDLARLGDAWPSPPEAWGPGDAELARRYLDDTDVVIWTPGRANGRPLAFQPLPDFAGVLDDDDEFTAAVEVAVASLAPQLRLTGSTGKVNIGLAVLRQAVVHYARKGSRSLEGLIDTLADLPPGVSTLNDGRRIAGDLAEMLKAAMVNDPLLAGGAQPVDPSVLLTATRGKRARVSVISFVGLPGEEQRQNFVNQLQMELFAWIKRNPAGDRPLGALFVMDEAQTMAASGTLTASARSTIVLASQARKYGLGLLFATQAPKGLHNQVAGNAMTQFFGRLNSPAQIAAANEMARAKGSPVVDISRLERGQFYVSGERFGFRQVETPLCLTHHPASPLRIEEVIERARQ